MASPATTDDIRSTLPPGLRADDMPRVNPKVRAMACE
jgi:hypothetical protein